MRLETMAYACLILFVLCATTAVVNAQGQGYKFTITSVEGNIGEIGTSHAYLNNPDAVQGWTIGICHDNTRANLLNVAESPDVTLVNGGIPADFTNMTVLADGWVGSVIVDLLSVNVIPAGEMLEVHRAQYQITTPGSAGICFCNSLGTPEVEQLVLTTGAVIQPSVVCAPPLPTNTDFRRGDANSDGTVSIGDAVRLLNFLFSNGTPIDCFDSGDLNDDGFLDISDTVFLLIYLFQPAGMPPPAPGAADCGPDVNIDFFQDCIYNSC